jgi:hypothetical protein
MTGLCSEAAAQRANSSAKVLELISQMLTAFAFSLSSSGGEGRGEEAFASAPFMRWLLIVLCGLGLGRV